MNRTIVFSLLCLVFSSLTSFAQDKEVFNIYRDSVEITYDEMLREFAGSDVLLFGEFHDNALIHWLQMEVLEELHKRRDGQVQVGMEMFERDDQLLIDEYMKGWISTKNFEKEAKLWNNYATDYKPILEFCRENEVPLYATNIPRRYASLVAHSGLDTLKHLSKTAKGYIPELPVKFDPEAPGYAMLANMGGHGSGMNYMPQAQAIKDATMAETIVNNKEKDHTFIHYHGNFHSANGGGIAWYLEEMKPNWNLSVVEVATSGDENLGLPETSKAKGVITIVVPENFTRTYR